LGQQKHQPFLGDLLHPRSDKRNALAEEEKAKVAMTQGTD
jgi:hypothetical protein